MALGTLVPRPLWPAPGDAPTRRILVLTNPIHTDIAIPLDDAVREKFAFLGLDGMPLDAPGARWLIFGWGGRAFYIETPTWADLKPGPLLKGLTLDAAAMHVDIAGAIAESHPAVMGFDVGEAAFSRLIDHIKASFSRNGTGPMVIVDAGYGQFDRFYEAEGRFTAILGCNTWAAAALREAGLRTGLWNPLPVLLGWSLALHN